jgi:cytochrome c oxidase subunit 4
MTGHVVSPRVYFAVFAALMVLTLVTVAVARQDLGSLNVVVALLIAGLKASLVVLYFMHARYSPRLIGLVVVAGIFFLAILLGITLSDYWTRGWLGVPGS